MPVLLPDPMTALTMMALSTGAMAWVMWALGRQYAQQGMAWAIASTLLYGLTYLCLGLHRHLATAGLLVTAQWLGCAAIAAFTLALQRWAQQRHSLRDRLTVLLPLLATLLLALVFLPQQMAYFLPLQLGLQGLQILYLLSILVRLRHRAPGSGWRCVTAAGLLQLAALTVVLAGAFSAGNELAPSAFTTWGVYVLLMLHLVLGSIGFLIMLREQALAVEHGKNQLDALTQLPNRAALVHTLQQAIEHAANQQQPLAVMVLDIDHFKSVNDSYGHLVGDHVIQSIARMLRQEGRSSDFSARYGGEEFVVVLPNTQAREAFHWAERLCQAVRKAPMTLPNGRLLHVTISVGVYAGMPMHGSTWERMVGAADAAMYVAKRNGRDRVAMAAATHTMQSQATSMA